jgi:hypothetical protein
MTTRLWRVCGVLFLVHIALVFAGVSLESTPFLGDSHRALSAELVSSSLSRGLAGSFIEGFGYLVLLVASVLLARLLRGTGILADWLSATVQATAVTFAAITFAGGFAGGLAAVWDGHAGVPLDSLIPVSDLRIWAFYVSIAVLGVFLLAAAGAVQVTGLLPRWLVWTGYAVGLLCLFSGPIEPVWDAINYGSLLFFVWLAALSVVAIRGPRAVRAQQAELAHA